MVQRGNRRVSRGGGSLYNHRMYQLRTVRSIAGLTLQALDGEIGSIQELYFDDNSWAVRYFVVSTGRWLFGRDVLLAPIAIKQVDGASGNITVNLTRAQIEQAPPVDRAKPVSREYEEAYYRHFNWAPYWQPGPMGAWTTPTPYPAVPHLSIDSAMLSQAPQHPHLRSSEDVTGYSVQAKDGEIGHVEDLVVTDDGWSVRYVVVDTRNWLPGRTVLVETVHVTQISWAELSVHVALHRRMIESAPDYDPSQLITPDYEIRLFKHYGREAA